MCIRDRTFSARTVRFCEYPDFATNELSSVAVAAFTSFLTSVSFRTPFWLLVVCWLLYMAFTVYPAAVAWAYAAEFASGTVYIYSVSYTHLDVYKRQIFRRLKHISDFLALCSVVYFV